MKFRIYAASMIGAGTLQDPWRNIIFDYKAINEKLSVYDFNHRMFSLCMLQAEDATHSIVAGMPEVTRLSPLADTYEDFLSDIDRPWTDFPEQARTEAAARLENDGGIPMSWIGPAASIRNIIRYIMKCQNVINQRLRGEKKIQALEFFKKHLNDQVKDIPVIQRNEIKDWMASKGLITEWISVNTFVREVLHFIVENLPIGTMYFINRNGDKINI
jgi:hypothetical protein